MIAPFPWFGGKRRAAPIVWERFGKVQNYVEPFFGSGAVLLSRKTPFDGVETVNDADGRNRVRVPGNGTPKIRDHVPRMQVVFVYRPVRVIWLVGQKDSLQARMEGDAEFFDAKTAGWWVWGLACWIGSGFCSGHGPWQVVEEDGVRQLVHLGDAGRGVNRKRDNHRECLFAYMRELSERLRHVRVCCGDWSRIMGETPTETFTPAGIFLDPPYADTAMPLRIRRRARHAGRLGICGG